MDNVFKEDESLYRAVLPSKDYWKEDGSVSSAAFKDSKGLSVDRGYYRSDLDVTKDMLKRLSGGIAKVFVKDCTDIGAIVLYLPTVENCYHSEIRGNEKMGLSKSQARSLARKAIIVHSSK